MLDPPVVPDFGGVVVVVVVGVPAGGLVVGVAWVAGLLGVGVFTVDWDSLSALDRWVETGEAPDDPIVADASPATHGRTRPLCRYPAWPRRHGSGDINDASNFSCVNP